MLFRCPMHVNRLLSLSAGLFDIPQLYMYMFSSQNSGGETVVLRIQKEHDI